LLYHNFGSIILILFLLTYDDILHHKYLLSIYVLPEDDPRRPKHVEEITMTKQFLWMNIYS